MRVTADEVERAVPLPTGPAVPPGFRPMPIPWGPASSPASGRWSILAIIALAVAVVGGGAVLARLAGGSTGVAILGMAMGLLAVLLGAIAVGTVQQTRGRGVWLGVGGLLLGLADIVGCVLFFAAALSHSGHGMVLTDFEPDADALDHLSPHIARAVRANVLVETQFGLGILGGAGIGSGVILDIHDASALILTNRHVVDPAFAEDDSKPAGQGLPDGRLQVKLIGQAPQPGHVVWIAPDGIDLALITVPVDGHGAMVAHWKTKPELMVGSDVFSIGNPQHLDWTHTRGSISQLRLQPRGSHRVRVIQTDAPLNPGNSGGGLYDKDGTLLGINTWTNDKRFSEGLGFAIALETLFDLDPPPLRGKTASDEAPNP